MSADNRVPLNDGYEVEVVEQDDFAPFFRKARPEVFDDDVVLIDQLLDAANAEARRALGARMGSPYRLQALVRRGPEIAGWTFGVQSDAQTFMMVNTGMYAEHRGRGVYTALLPWVLDTVRAEGFQIVTSRHVATNGRVLVPKLKAGFLITGVEMMARFGLVLHLNKYFDPARERLIRWRVGELRPDDEIRRVLRPEG